MSEAGQRAVGPIHRLAQAIRVLVPDLVACSAGSIDGAPYELYAEEHAAVADAVPVRRAEFAAGRFHARSALGLLGHPSVPIPVRMDRSPVWPSGFVGSISHTRQYCAAVAVRCDSCASIGLDMEVAKPLPQDLLRMVQRSDETDVPRHGLPLGKLLFVLKEAAYKAWYPLAGEILDFHDMRIWTDPTQPTFRAKVVRPGAAPLGVPYAFSGKFGVWGKHLIAVAMPVPQRHPVGGKDGAQDYPSVGGTG